MQFYLHNGKMDDKTEKVAIHGRAQFNEKFVLQLKKNPMGNDDEATKSLLKIHNGAKIYILLDLNWILVMFSNDFISYIHSGPIWGLFMK